MHPNPIFRKAPKSKNIEFLKDHSFGTLLINGPQIPLAAYIPFLLNDDENVIHLHLVRSNPIAQRLKSGPIDATISVIGPHGYISPDWYDEDDMVPTWNYVAVQVSGRLTLCDQADLESILEQLSYHFEQQLLPKPIWSIEKMSQQAIERMLRQIVPCHMDIEQIDGTWKLGQNKPKDALKGAILGLQNSQIGMKTQQLADWMQQIIA